MSLLQNVVKLFGLNIIKLVKHYERLAQSHCPINKFYETLLEQSDKLIPAKLQFLIDIAENPRPFLTRFQTDKAMLPFMEPSL